MPQRRAVITGLGAVTPFGVGVEAFRLGLLEGRSAVRRVSLSPERGSTGRDYAQALRPDRGSTRGAR